LPNGVEAHARKAWLGGLAELGPETVNYERGREIYGEDDPARYVWQVVRGAVCGFKTLPDGRRQIIAFDFPGDLFGLLRPDRYLLTARAVCDTQVLRIARSRLARACTENIELARRIEGIAARAIERIQEHSVLLGRTTANERVAAFLLEMDQHQGAGDGAIILSMSRRDIADYLGLTLETVSRVMTHFTRAGTVNIAGRRITLRRRNLLAACVNSSTPSIRPSFVFEDQKSAARL
jgi:CRP/FNR family nitrogen fixation transcriptional regulator